MALHRGGVEPVESDWVKEKQRAVRFTTLGGGDGFAVNTNVIMLMGGEVFVDECFFNDLKGYQGNTSSVEREPQSFWRKKFTVIKARSAEFLMSKKTCIWMLKLEGKTKIPT